MRVISNGEVKIEQYCKYDGYPTGRGYQIMIFFRNLYNSKRVEEFKQYLETTELVDITDKPIVNVNGEGNQIDEEYWESYAMINIYIKEHFLATHLENVEEMLNACLISESEAQYYMAMSCQTGNQVLDYVLKHKPQKMKFFLDQNTYEYGIESEYTIDLDKQKIEFDWHEDYVQHFHELSKMSDEEIYAMMEEIECGDEEDDD